MLNWLGWQTWRLYFDLVLLLQLKLQVAKKDVPQFISGASEALEVTLKVDTRVHQVVYLREAGEKAY